MTEREPDAHLLQPELTLAGLVAVLPSWVRPDPEREDWLEVLRERLPPALASKLLLPLVQSGSLGPDGRVVLPRADWEGLAERLLFQARAVLESRDALLLAEAGPPSDEIAWSPHVEDWRAMDLGVVTPYLAGRIVGPLPGEPDTFGPKPLVALGPGQAWARLLQGWVSLGRRADLSPPAEPRRAFPPRPLDEAETVARLADLRRRIETQVADLVPPLSEAPLSGVVSVKATEDGAAAQNQEEEGMTQAGVESAGTEQGRAGVELTEAEWLLVRFYRLCGAETPLWLLSRSAWLGQERPIDLLENQAYRERLADYLTAMENGGYLGGRRPR